MSNPCHPLTIHDVARRAGVSVTAVSHALNNKGTLSAETRARVKAVADELNYRADALARGLRRAPLGVVGFVIRPLDALGEYRPEGVDVFARASASAAAAAMDRGLGLMLLPDLSRGPLPPLAMSLDGYVIVDPVREDPVIELMLRYGIPYVTLGSDPSRPGLANRVEQDVEGGTLLALDDLGAAGAHTVVFVAGTAADGWNIDSERAYLRWCAKRCVRPRVLHLVEGAGEEGGRGIVREIVTGGVPDAVFCMTGRHAAGVQAGLAERGLRSPEDVLLATGSDAEQSRTGSPPISAVELVAEPLGIALVGMLTRMIDGDPPDTPVILDPVYHARATTRPAPHPKRPET